MAQLAQGLGLDLPDALARDPELASDLFQGPRPAVVEPEAQLQNLALTRTQRLQHTLQLLLEHRERRGLCGSERVTILDEVPEVAVLFLADRRLQRDRAEERGVGKEGRYRWWA